jgi:hypothetical protein
MNIKLFILYGAHLKVSGIQLPTAPEMARAA